MKWSEGFCGVSVVFIYSYVWMSLRVCDSAVCVFVLKLFVLRPSSFVMLQSICVIILLISVLFVIYLAFFCVCVCVYLWSVLFLLMCITFLAFCIQCKVHCHQVETLLEYINILSYRILLWKHNASRQFCAVELLLCEFELLYFSWKWIWPITVVLPSKTWVSGRSNAGIAVLNLAEGMDVRLLCWPSIVWVADSETSWSLV